MPVGSVPLHLSAVALIAGRGLALIAGRGLALLAGRVSLARGLLAVETDVAAAAQLAQPQGPQAAGFIAFWSRLVDPDKAWPGR